MDAETTAVQAPSGQPATPKKKEAHAEAKVVRAEKHAHPLDKFAERRLAVKRQKRKAHRHNIAASNRNG